MSNHSLQSVPQALTAMETEALFDLLEQLEKQGWGYGVNSNLMRGVFIGPNGEFDLWPSMRTGERTLQWSLQYPSTAGQTGRQPQGTHTLLWEYTTGSTIEDSMDKFVTAALASISEITALPRL